MSLPDLLRHHLVDRQTSIAMDWLGQLQRDDPAAKKHSPAHVESQFSRCLKGEVGAVRFFFAQRAHAVALLNAMAVADQERDAVLVAAEGVLSANAETPPRLVIDVTPWAAVVEPTKLLDSLLAQVVQQQLIEPVTLLLSDALYDLLPRSFDNERGLRVEVIEGDSRARVLELTAHGALLLSPRQDVSPERWLATQYDERPGVLSFEPPDGLQVFAREGALALPAVTHDLASYIDDLDLPLFDAASLSGAKRRRYLMSALRDEKRAELVEPDARKRLAMAKMLGIAVTSTARDRMEAELRAAAAGLGVPHVARASDDKLQAILERARRRSLSFHVVRVGDELHCVNPASEQPGLDHPRVRVHRIDAPEPWITRLRAELAGWTVGDFEADPYLVDAMERLDPDRQDVLPLLHARAWLGASGSVTPRPGEPVADWRGALRRLLARPVPPAMLRIDIDGQRLQGDAFYTIAPGGRIGAPLAELDERTAETLRHIPPLSPFLSFDRAHPVRVASPPPVRHYSYQPIKLLALPNPEEEPPKLDARWLDAYDAFLAAAASPPRGERAGIQLRDAAEPPWAEADELLLKAWLALSASLESAPTVRARSGQILLAMGGGLAATIEVCATARAQGEKATLLWRMETPQYRSGALTTDIFAGIDGLSYKVPHGIVLCAEQLRAEIRFTASPLLLGLGAPGLGSIAAPQHAAALAADRRAAEADARDNED